MIYNIYCICIYIYIYIHIYITKINCYYYSSFEKYYIKANNNN